MAHQISVVIPVGPYPANKRWLHEAMFSVYEQTELCNELLLVLDGSQDVQVPNNPILRSWSCPWRTGISHAFNYGVMLARNELVFMLGSDDTLEPNCLERCMEAYEKNNREDAYYSVPIRYMDTGEVQTAPCNAAMVTKGFWRLSGGFPIQSAVGIGDSTLLSICLKHNLPVQWVGELTGQPDVPLYNYRRHPDIHTYKLGPWWGVASSIRDICTSEWAAEEVAIWSNRY